MPRKKKKQLTAFTKDKNAFSDSIPIKGDNAKNAKQKQFGTHQPRDADKTSGHDVQKFKGEPEGGNFQENRDSFQGDTRKTAGRKIKFNYKKRRQSKPPLKKKRFTEQKEKTEVENPQDNGKSVFLKEENTFTEDNEMKRSGKTKQTKPKSKNSFRSATRKNVRQKTSPNKKERSLPKQLQKENNFTEWKEKTENGNPQDNVKNDFFKEENIFAEEHGGEQTEETKKSKDNYRHKDIYHQDKKKGSYQKRVHQEKNHAKKSDLGCGSYTKDDIFTENNILAGSADTEFQSSKKLKKLQGKAERATERTEKARRKLPKKKEYSLERVFDEKTGRANYVLTAVEKEKPFKGDNPVRRMAGKVGSESIRFAHGKVAEVEKDNSALEGAHKTEQKTEDTYHFVKQHYKRKGQRQREKVAKLEKKQFKGEVNFRYQKFLEENPEMQEKSAKKQIQKRLQKQRIKREYAKARQAGQVAKSTKEEVIKSANFTTIIVKKLQEMAAKHASVLVIAGVSSVLLIMVMTCISSCGAMFSDGMSTTFAGNYVSVPAEIDAADFAFSELEMKLQKKIASLEMDYPDYDEYRYNLDAIGHDPFTFISYLSAVHTEFIAADVQTEIESLFDEMYELILNPTEETRTRIVTKIGTRTVTNADGTTSMETYTYEEEEEYTVTILEATLIAEDLNMVVTGRMNGEQQEFYALYNETHGLTQQFYTPLNLYWYNHVSSYYGYRTDPATGEEQLHRGIDIAVPAGMEVLAAMDGTVTIATYDSHYGNYIVIEDSKGYCTKYAHMNTLSVSVGQNIKHGDTIGITGNTGGGTGSHLHIECLYNGKYYNPLFYFETGAESF